MAGRTAFTEETASKICSEIANGSNLLRICELGWSPNRDTIYKWLSEQPAFSDNYARARLLRADVRSDRIERICAKVEAGELDANSARVIIDAEKWQAGKENPKVYGDRIENRLSGPEGEALKIVVTGIRPTEENSK